MQILKPNSGPTKSKYLKISHWNLYFNKHNFLFMILMLSKFENYCTIVCANILPTGLISWWVVMVGWRCSRTWLTQSDWPLNGPLTYRWADEFLTLQGLSLLGAGVMLQSVKCTLIIYFHINYTEQWYEVIISMFQENDPVSFIVKWGFFNKACFKM